MSMATSAAGRAAGWAGIAAVWAVPAVLLAMTAWAFVTVRADHQRAAQTQFASRGEEVADAIETRVAIYEQMLRGGLGLFRGSQAVTREEWHDYVAALEVDRRFPGIQGMGYAVYIRGAERAAFEAAVRAEGLPDFAIQPPGERDVHIPVTYLEPPDRRNKAALGFDMYAEAVRHDAFDLAIRTGEPAISGKVRLAQEIDDNIQSGFLLYLPHFVSREPDGAAPSPAEETRRIEGFVYGAFRMNDLMAGVLGPSAPDVRLCIFDGDSQDREALMFDDAPEGTPPPAFVGRQALRIGQRRWTLVVTSLPAFEARVASPTAALILAAGIPASLLVFGLLWSFAHMGRRAEALAVRLSADARDRQARIAAVLETVVDGILTVDEAGRIESVNPAAERIFAYTAAFLAGCDISLLIPGRDVGGGFAGALGVGGREVVGRRSDGTTFPMELAVGEMHVGGRRMFTGIVRDISGRKADERLKDEFIATASHELRTPVTSIRGAIGLLRVQLAGTLPEAARELIDMAQRNSDRLVRLLDDILDMEKIGAGRMEFRLLPVGVPELIEGALRENRGYAESYGVSLAIEGSLPAATVTGDEDRLMQVLGNLLSNAAKFSPRGGTVRLSAARHGDMVRLSVADTGPGIPAAFQSRIFEKFAQADASDARRKGGSGLGLGIAKAIVERHGGRLSFDTMPGLGTTFHVDLPLAAA